MPRPRACLLLVLLVAGCGGGGGGKVAKEKGPLRINEVMADDEGGTTIDEFGRIGDWIELVNTGETAVDISAYTLSDGEHPDAPLPAKLLGAGATILLWADGEPTRGEAHLDFKISSKGDQITLRDSKGEAVGDVTTPALAPNEAYARIPDGGDWTRCHYATPGRTNGDRCGPPPPPDLPDELHFSPFTWPEDEAAPLPLAISEAALFPARFVEVTNTSAAAVALADFVLRLQPFHAGEPLPGAAAGAALVWPVATLAAGERLAVPVAAGDEAPLDAEPEREGVVALFRAADGAAVDRADFMRWPDGAALVRATLPAGGLSARRFLFCATATPGNVTAACDAVASRDVGDRIHALRTPGDFAALAAGATELGSESIKFVVDMEAGDTVHFLATKRWPLHYTFVRERIYRQPALDRCDPVQDQAFVNGWYDFSNREYRNNTASRRFLLGTLVRWPSGLSTMEFASGDYITGEQMRRAFFAVTARTPNLHAWAVRPQTTAQWGDGRDDQIQHARDVDGTLPIVDPNAPFRGRTIQPLVAGVAYGVLRFVAGAELETASLGPGVIVVTDEVPNDIPLVGGLVTEAFQTPLAHVAVLSKNRGTPNMALLDARHDGQLAPFFDQLVRLEVSGAGFTIAATTAEEAAAFWQTRWPPGPLLTPRLDTSVRGPVDLRTRGLADLPSVGAKAAQLGELYQIPLDDLRVRGCASGLPLPTAPFAIPVVHGLEHFAASGAAALFEASRATPAFVADPAVRAQALADVRGAIMAHPVEPGLLASVAAELGGRFGGATVRLRSSSNTEDLPGFSGAGLYASVSAKGDDPEELELGIKTVWASLWQPRAYDERELAHVDHSRTAIAVLVHEAFPDERANGVAISRNILDPIYGDAYYFNAQAGEASVTNPAPGVASDEGFYQRGLTPPISYTGRSSLVTGPVLAEAEVEGLMCALGAIHDHFRAAIDPTGENHWFAVDIEWKRLGPERRLLIKQARPYNFGSAAVPTDCREF